MDPRDWLWVELIFPQCEPVVLLALRAVCPAFLAQLNAAPARLWHRLTMVVSRMRYDEQLAGWASVERAMKREEVTRANCDAGRYTRAPVLGVRTRQLLTQSHSGPRSSVSATTTSRTYGNAHFFSDCATQTVPCSSNDNTNLGMKPVQRPCWNSARWIMSNRDAAMMHRD